MSHQICADKPRHGVLQILSMPALSPTMSQGNVASWQVSEGAEITAGDILADIETDKATLPWENQDDGFIAKLLKPGGSKDIPVGMPLVVLVEEKEHIADFKDFSPEGSSAGADASEQTEQQAGALLQPIAIIAATPCIRCLETSVCQLANSTFKYYCGHFLACSLMEKPDCMHRMLAKCRHMLMQCLSPF